MRFKHCFREAIESGVKTSTIRKNCRFKMKKSLKTNLGFSIIIIDKTLIKLDNVTDEQAFIDGFKGKEELKEFINNIYPNVTDLILINFKLDDQAKE